MSDAESIEAKGDVVAPVRLDTPFLALLCCPICVERPPLEQIDEGLHCRRCGCMYPIRDGLPDLRPESGVLPTAAE